MNYIFFVTLRMDDDMTSCVSEVTLRLASILSVTGIPCCHNNVFEAGVRAMAPRTTECSAILSAHVTNFEYVTGSTIMRNK